MEREFNDMKDVFKVLPTTQEEKEYMYRDWETIQQQQKNFQRVRQQKKESTRQIGIQLER